MKKSENSNFSENREYLRMDSFISPSEKNVVTKILFPGSNGIVRMKVTFPDSIDDSPNVIVENAILILEPNFYFFESQGIIAGIILRDGMEETVLLYMMVTASGKLILQRINCPKDTGEVSMEILYPKT